MTSDSDALTNAGLSSRSHRLDGILRCVLLVFTFGMFAMLLMPGQAEAHGLHAHVVAADVGGEAGEMAEDLASDAAQCETICCSSTACASAVLSIHDPSPRLDARSDRFSPPSDASAAGVMQTALRRPPKA